jgi:hypothetical protein
MLFTRQLGVGTVTCWRFFLLILVLMGLVLFPMLVLVLFTSFLRMSVAEFMSTEHYSCSITRKRWRDMTSW